MKSHEAKAHPCPAGCGEELNAATGVGHERAPKPGDVSMCYGCASFLVFTDELTTRLAELDDLDELDLVSRAMLERARRTRLAELERGAR